MSGRNFIQAIIEKDLATGARKSVITRFPPEPNGYLHIGHAKSICLNFGLAQKYGGRCHLRFDDTNPLTESTEYVESIQEDVRWLGFDWGEHLYFASDYFDQLYEWAVHLIKTGFAYVDSQSKEDIRKQRGSLFIAGTNSPYRNRSIEENLEEFERMRSGLVGEGEGLLRAKIDMSSPNMNMRDPPLYRVMHKSHHRTGSKWCIYPLYDFAHGQEDAIEHISHSICTLEFDNHRELYDWFLDHLPVPSRPKQFEFARLNVTNTVMSKRKLLRLVQEGVVDGWDDPRMPTISGMRRRGVTPLALRTFCERVGVTRINSTIDSALLDDCIREDLDPSVPRRFAVLNPLRVVIDSLGSDEVISVNVQNHPLNAEMGSRELKICKVIYIDRDDFRECANDDYYRLIPNGRCKLRNAFVIKVDSFTKNENGQVTQLNCSHEPDTLHSMPKDVRGIIHWVSECDSVTATVQLFNPLILEDASSEEQPEEDSNEEAGEVEWINRLNPDSKIAYKFAKVERSIAQSSVSDKFQFERVGYFIVDRSTTLDALVINRIVSLKESGLKKDEGAEANRSRKEEQMKQKAAKEALKLIRPEDLFKSQTDKYSRFDESGIPTHDANGTEITKTQMKKILKELEKHKRIEGLFFDYRLIEEDVKSEFSKFGKINDVVLLDEELIPDIAIVEFDSPTSATAAVNALDCTVREVEGFVATIRVILMSIDIERELLVKAHILSSAQTNIVGRPLDPFNYLSSSVQRYCVRYIIGADKMNPEYSVIGRILGVGGEHVKAIFRSTNANVRIIGKPKSLDDPLCVRVSADDISSFTAGREMTESLIADTYADYTRWCERHYIPVPVIRLKVVEGSEAFRSISRILSYT